MRKLLPSTEEEIKSISISNKAKKSVYGELPAKMNELLLRTLKVSLEHYQWRKMILFSG